MKHVIFCPEGAIASFQVALFGNSIFSLSVFAMHCVLICSVAISFVTLENVGFGILLFNLIKHAFFWAYIVYRDTKEDHGLLRNLTVDRKHTSRGRNIIWGIYVLFGTAKQETWIFVQKNWISNTSFRGIHILLATRTISRKIIHVYSKSFKSMYDVNLKCNLVNPLS